MTVRSGCLCCLIAAFLIAMNSTAFHHWSGNSVVWAADEDVVSPQQQEKIALKFAKEHHRELFKLVSQLKDMDSQQYQSAIAELYETSERIGKYAEKTPERFAAEIELWKIDSRVRLLVARSVAGMDDKTRDEVKRLLRRRNEIQAEQLQRDRDKLHERLVRIEKQITDLNDRGEELAENELDRLLRTAQNRSAANRRSPAAAKSSDNTPGRSGGQESKATPDHSPHDRHKTIPPNLNSNEIAPC